MVFRDVAYEVDVPALVGGEGDVGLIVQEVGLVFTFRLQRPQQVAVGLVAQSVTHGEFLVAVAQEGAAAQQRGL